MPQQAHPPVASEVVLARPSEPPPPVSVVRGWFAPPWTTKKISILTGAGGVLLGFVFVLVAVAGGKKTSAASAASADTSSRPRPVESHAPETASQTAPPPSAQPATAAEARSPAPVSKSRRTPRLCRSRSTADSSTPWFQRRRSTSISKRKSETRCSSPRRAPTVGLRRPPFCPARELQMTFTAKTKGGARTTAAPPATTKRPWSKRPK